jgi:hypothetical protein
MIKETDSIHLVCLIHAAWLVAATALGHINHFDICYIKSGGIVQGQPRDFLGNAQMAKPAPSNWRPNKLAACFRQFANC